MRFGHLKFQVFKEMGDKYMVDVIQSINHTNQLCEACPLQKHARMSFPNDTTSRTSKSLQLVHTAVCDPINTSSFGKRKYFLLFIDDFSRKTWVYFLKKKSEVFVAFKNFKALVEKKSGYEIKALRSDRGGEFTSKEFYDFCQSHEIHHPLMVPYSPQ